MEPRQSGGISVDSIELLDCHVGNIKLEVPRLGASKNYNLGLTSFTKSRLQENGGLKAIASFDLMCGIENPVCIFKCTFSIRYSSGGDPGCLDALKDHVIIAHILPFLREFVWNTTMRMPVAGLMMRPVNAVQLIDRFKRTQEALPQTTPSPDPQ